MQTKKREAETSENLHQSFPSKPKVKCQETRQNREACRIDETWYKVLNMEVNF